MFPTVSKDNTNIGTSSRPANRSRQLLPAEFDICLSNRCNLACRYCYWDKTVRTTREELSFGQVARGLELYLSAKKGTEIAKISISGGEPFLNFPLLARTARHARKMVGSGIPIEVFTNGTHLTERNVRYLLDQNIRLVVSMDGKKRTHDSNRVFRSKPGTSVFDVVMANLQRLPRDCIERMYAGATFTSKTAPMLGQNVKFLLGLGFREVLVDLDILEVWPPGRLDGFREGLVELKKLYTASAANGFGSQHRPRFCLDFLPPKNEIHELKNLSCFREISLAPDGCFYPNGLVSTHGPEKTKYRIGDLKSGFDFQKMQGLLNEAAAFFTRAPFKGYAACPVHIYFDCLLKGKNPVGIFTGGERVYLCADEVVGGVIEFERVNDFLASHPSFGDFDHRPKHVGREEIGSLKLGLGNSPDIRQAREAVDFFLYSPGDEKQLTIHWENSRCSFDVLEAVAIYSIMKAGYLGKRISISMLGSWNAIEREHLRFLRDHGIELCILAEGDKPGSDPGAVFQVLERPQVKAVLGLMPRDAGMLMDRFRGLVALGFESFCLEVVPGQRWSGSSIGSLRADLSAFERYVCGQIEAGRNLFVGNFGDILARNPETGREEESAASRLVHAACRRAVGRMLNLSANRPEYRSYVRESIAMARRLSHLFAANFGNRRFQEHLRSRKILRREGELTQRGLE